MKKLLIATLIGCTALCSMNVSAKEKSYSEKDLVGTWQCEAKDENTSLIYTSKYAQNNKAYDEGKIIIDMGKEVFSYDISMNYDYKVKGNQISTIGKIDKFQANHNVQAQFVLENSEFLKEFDSMMEQSVRILDGKEFTSIIQELTKNKLVILSAEDDKTPAICKRIK